MKGDWEYKVGDILVRVGDTLHLYVVAERGRGAYYFRMKVISNGRYCGFPWFDKYDVEDGQFIRVDDVGE